MMRTTNALRAAILLWKRGDAPDTSLYMKLSTQGYDVASLERRYRA